jgi:hypothetical protein
MPASDRELLITGTHPACWEKMFSEFEWEDEDVEHDSEVQDGLR